MPSSFDQMTSRFGDLENEFQSFDGTVQQRDKPIGGRLSRLYDMGMGNQKALGNNIQEIDKEFQSHGMDDLYSFLGEAQAVTTPISRFYQEKIRPAAANVFADNRDIEALQSTFLGKTPIPALAKAGKGIMGLGASYLESLLNTVTGGSPKEYEMKKTIERKLSSNQELTPEEAAFVKRLGSDFVMESARMVGAVTPVTAKDVTKLAKKLDISRDDAEYILTKRRINEMTPAEVSYESVGKRGTLSPQQIKEYTNKSLGELRDLMAKPNVKAEEITKEIKPRGDSFETAKTIGNLEDLIKKLKKGK